MRILMTTTNSSLMDGINRHILTISKALNRCSKIEVAVCTTFVHGELNQEIEANGIKTFALCAKHGHQIKVFFNFLKVLREFQPDVIHIHMLPFLAQVVLSIFFRNIRYVQTVHGIIDEPVSLRGRIRQKIVCIMNNLFAIKINHTIFISDGVREYLSNEEPPKELGAFKGVSVIYNPMDLCLQQYGKDLLCRRLGLPKNTQFIGTACRIASVKNPEAFTKVFCYVLKQEPSAHAVIIGDGDENLLNAIKQIIQTFDLKDRIHLLGYCPNALELIAGLDCFVMTSRSEGMPTALLEAMSVNVPVAFMRGNGGLRDLEKLNREMGRFACIAGQGEEFTLANEIVSMLKDTSLRKKFTQNASMLLNEKFSTSSTTSMLIAVYERVMKQ